MNLRTHIFIQLPILLNLIYVHLVRISAYFTIIQKLKFRNRNIPVIQALYAILTLAAWNQGVELHLRILSLKRRYVFFVVLHQKNDPWVEGSDQRTETGKTQPFHKYYDYKYAFGDFYENNMLYFFLKSIHVF